MPEPTSTNKKHNYRHWFIRVIELFSSMRFAISILTLIAIASIIGTVLKQNEPMPNYVNQLGAFWFNIFDQLGVYEIYSSWWFLLMMAFLVTSTSLCIMRNAPKMIKDTQSWRDNIHEESLRNFHYHFEWNSTKSPAELTQHAEQYIKERGYNTKIIEKEHATLVAAKRGAASKLGYIFAHSAIVIICIGGLLDSNLPIQAQQWLMHKTPFTGNGIIADIPNEHRLSVNNPTFRGNMLLPEKSSSSAAIVSQKNGVLIQDLPFSLRLEQFIIDYYSTGMPKLFASDVTLTDTHTGKSIKARIKVNEPLIYKDIAIYQSSFEDGGSQLNVLAYPMSGAQSTPTALSGIVGGNTKIPNMDQYTIEWTGFRPLNVDTVTPSEKNIDPTKQSTSEKITAALNKHTGFSASENKVKNVGPSIQYKLRDSTGQAREYQNYMQSISLDGTLVFLSGVRAAPNDPFQFLRIPADDNDSVKEWMHLRAALTNPQLRERAAKRYVERLVLNQSANIKQLRTQLQQSANNSLSLFAGNAKDTGYIAVSKFLSTIPPTDQKKTTDIFLKMLHGSMWELWQLDREDRHLPAVPADDKHTQFLQLSMNAFTDAAFYGAPLYLELLTFNEVKASVFQITKSPGKKIVYLGSLFLVLGVFAMFYIRERRIWVWVKKSGAQSTALFAMSTQRKTLDFEQEFLSFKDIIATSTNEHHQKIDKGH